MYNKKVVDKIMEQLLTDVKNIMKAMKKNTIEEKEAIKKLLEKIRNNK